MASREEIQGMINNVINETDYNSVIQLQILKGMYQDAVQEEYRQDYLKEVAKYQ